MSDKRRLDLNTMTHYSDMSNTDSHNIDMLKQKMKDTIHIGVRGNNIHNISVKLDNIGLASI